MLTELVCSACHRTYSVYRPSRDEIDEPFCSDCTITTARGVAKLLGYESSKLYGQWLKDLTNKKERVQ